MAKGKSRLSESDGAIQREPEMVVPATDAPQDGMMAEERRTQILQTVRSAGRVRVNELAAGSVPRP